MREVTSHVVARVDGQRCVGCNATVVDAYFCLGCAIGTGSRGDDVYSSTPTSVSRAMQRRVSRASEHEHVMALQDSTDKRARRLALVASDPQVTPAERARSQQVIDAMTPAHEWGYVSDIEHRRRRAG